MDKKEDTRELVVVDVTRYKKVKAALKDSEERYRQLFENVPIGIYRTTPDGRIVDANPALVKMAGCASFAELVSLDMKKEYGRSSLKRSDFIERLKRDGEVRGLEMTWRTRDGKEIHVRENAKLIRGQNGEVFFEGTVEDISQSKLVEGVQKLRSQQLEIINSIIASGNTCDSLEELLDSILDHVLKPLDFTMAGIFMYDAALKKVDVAAYRGVRKRFFKDSQYMSLDSMPFSQVLLHGQPVFVDNTKHVIPDLTRKYKWQMAGSVPMLSKGRVVGAINVASGERAAFSPEEKHILELIGKEAGTLVSKLQTEAALRKSEKYYRTLIDTSPDIIVVLGLDARLITVNQQFLKAGGYFYDEVIGASTFDFIAGLDRLLLENKTSQFIKNKKTSGSNYLFKIKNGQAIPLEVEAALLHGDDGRPMGIIAIGRDIRERQQAEEKLRHSEIKYRELVENHDDVIFWVDAVGKIEYISPAITRITGYLPEEVTGMNLFDFFSPEERRQHGERMLRTTAVGSSVGEYPITVKDGSRKWIRASSRSIVEDGQVVGVRGIMSDISERKKDEEQLRFLGSITENTSDAIIVTDADFAITYINRVGEAFFGYSLDELKGRTPDLFNAEPRADEIQRELYRTVAAGKTYLGESINRRKDGSTFFCEYKVMPLKDSQGKIYAFSSVQRDISERKRNEEVLRQSEESFRRTFEAIPDPAYVWTLDEDGRLLLSKYNQAAEQITNGGIKKYLGIEAKKLFADNPVFVDHILQTMDDGRRQSSEVLYTYQSVAGSKWLQVDYVKTAAKSVMVITKDISERKEAEAKLLAYQEQLRALTSEIVLVEERERRRIASELHDQIGQNLALCKLKVTALEANPGSDAMREELAVVRRLLDCSIQDARSLIFDLSPPVLYELGLSAALEWLAERMQEQFHIPVEFESRCRDLELQGDQQVILFQVVRELMINVGKHARASQAKVILGCDGPSLRIQVNDDGVGFDASKVFGPREANSGFGFFSIRERLNYVGGQVEVRSKPGQGSQIILTIPKAGVGPVPKKEKT